MTYPYNNTYDPAFPSIPVILHNEYEGLSTDEVSALLDTGADGSLIPLTYLERILAPVLTDARIRSHWGEWRSVQLFTIAIEIGGLRLPEVFVIGDDQGSEIVLGRNILNKLRILFDGPASSTNILP